jgi:hypothetical protein
MSASPLEILTLTVSALSMIAAAAAGVYAGRAAERARAANQIAEASLRFQVLLPALFEYRSAEMLVAIRSLWGFAREHPDDIAEAYKSQRERDSHDLAGLKGDEHLNYLRTTYRLSSSTSESVLWFSDFRVRRRRYSTEVDLHALGQI